MRNLSPADDQSNAQTDVLESLNLLLLQADADRLARQLGLRSAAAAQTLRANPAALKRLSTNLLPRAGEDVEDMLKAARALLWGEAS